MMKSGEMREMTVEELKLHHAQLVDELVHARLKLSMRQLDQPLQVRGLRREIARARTILQERSAGATPRDNAAAEKR
jgi:large subunit ribosomal protein L29